MGYSVCSVHAMLDLVILMCWFRQFLCKSISDSYHYYCSYIRFFVETCETTFFPCVALWFIQWMSEFCFKHFSAVANVHTVNVATIKKDKKELDFVLFLLEKCGRFSFILGVFGWCGGCSGLNLVYTIRAYHVQQRTWGREKKIAEICLVFVQWLWVKRRQHSFIHSTS